MAALYQPGQRGDGELRGVSPPTPWISPPLDTLTCYLRYQRQMWQGTKKDFYCEKVRGGFALEVAST